MDRVVILQSFREHDVSRWLERCMASVQAWAGRHGYEYRFIGDELFELVPDWYQQKVGPRFAIWADLARLVWIRDCLSAGHADLVGWVDADVYVFAPQHLTLAPQTSCVFGLEHWVQDGDKGLRVHRNVHNAWCGFRKDCPILPFLIEVVQRLIRRVDADHIAPQFVGPKLLSSLHTIADFELAPGVGALSRELVAELAGEPGAAMALLRQSLAQPLLAANLCASLQSENPESMMRVMDRLDEFSSGLI